MRTRLMLLAVLTVLAGTVSARAELTLFAKYDWQNGATDVSGSPIQHDGVLDPGAVAANGTLTVQEWDGVDLGYLPELDGAEQVLLRFDDVTFNQYGSPGSGALSTYAVLAGGADWWVGVMHYLPPYYSQTWLGFNFGAWGHLGNYCDLSVFAADEVVSHFDRIEYRYDVASPPDHRLAIRWNDGAWVTGGCSTLAHFPSFVSTQSVRINDGARSDWDPMWATLGPVSLYSEIPEPATLLLLVSGAIACGVAAQCRGIRNRS